MTNITATAGSVEVTTYQGMIEVAIEADNYESFVGMSPAAARELAAALIRHADMIAIEM